MSRQYNAGRVCLLTLAVTYPHLYLGLILSQQLSCFFLVW